jgi:hypothetical protein
MAGVIFSHQSMNALVLRLPPTSVNWSFTLNTSVTNTYAGQVVQLLSINFDKLILEGQFGKEGPQGLRDMTDWFRRYFEIASQGTNGLSPYNESPVRVKYEGKLDVEIDEARTEYDWLVYPISFPSYSRSNQEFAPKWKVEMEVFEPSGAIRHAEMNNQLLLLRERFAGVGYEVYNRFSDPAIANIPEGEAITPGRIKSEIDRLNEDISEVFDHYKNLLPAYDADDIEELLHLGASVPAVFRKAYKRGAQGTSSTGRIGSSGIGGGSHLTD